MCPGRDLAANRSLVPADSHEDLRPPMNPETTQGSDESSSSPASGHSLMPSDIEETCSEIKCFSEKKKLEIKGSMSFFGPSNNMQA